MKIRERIFAELLALEWNTRYPELNKDGDSQIAKLWARMHHWGDYVEVKDGNYTLRLTKKHAGLRLIERNSWPKWYGDNFQGLRVLDVGAGAGETASFFLNLGALCVYAIEPDPKAVKMLKHNAEVNRWPIFIYEEMFSLAHLEILPPFDYMKMDIEGGERELLAYDGKLKPSRIELHPQFLGKDGYLALINKFGLLPVQKPYVWRTP